MCKKRKDVILWTVVLLEKGFGAQAERGGIEMRGVW